MDQSAPLLELDRVFAGYGKMTILNGTSARVRRGAITTVIGPNGAGKSTMFKTVFGLLPVRSGTIGFDGRDITNCTPRQTLDAGIVYIPQGRNIFSELSVRHNLELGGLALPDQALLADRMAAIMRRFPMLQDKANAQASTLSGGQQKILDVAGAVRRCLRCRRHRRLLSFAGRRSSGRAPAAATARRCQNR